MLELWFLLVTNRFGDQICRSQQCTSGFFGVFFRGGMKSYPVILLAGKLTNVPWKSMVVSDVFPIGSSPLFRGTNSFVFGDVGWTYDLPKPWKGPKGWGNVQLPGVGHCCTGPRSGGVLVGSSWGARQKNWSGSVEVSIFCASYVYMCMIFDIWYMTMIYIYYILYIHYIYNILYIWYMINMMIWYMIDDAIWLNTLPIQCNIYIWYMMIWYMMVIQYQ